MRTVRKGWIRLSPSDDWWRCLMDDRGRIFMRGHGWSVYRGVETRILPKAYLCERWAYAERWSVRLWRRPEWAWIYSA